MKNLHAMTDNPTRPPFALQANTLRRIGHYGAILGSPIEVRSYEGAIATWYQDVSGNWERTSSHAFMERTTSYQRTLEEYALTLIEQGLVQFTDNGERVHA